MSKAEILILEDEAFIAMDIEMTLNEAGYKTISAHSDAPSALASIEQSEPAAALLDFNLGQGETSLPVARALKARDIPFAFLTGYTDATVSTPEELADARRLSKPFNKNGLIRAVEQLLSDA